MTIAFDIRRLLERLLLVFLFIVILWKGGKALDAVWALGAVASLFTLSIEGTPGVSVIPRRQHPLVLWVSLLMFVILTCISFIYSTTKNYGFDEVVQTVSLFLLFSILGSLSTSFTSRFLRAISLALLFACLIGAGTYILQPVSRFVGPFFDFRFHTDYWPNAWAQFALLAWPMLLWILFFRSTDDRDVRSDLLRASVLGIVFGCFFLSFSRGASIALLMQLLIVVSYILLRTKCRLPWKRIGVIAFTALIVSFFVFLSLNHIRSQFHAVESVAKKVTLTSAEGSSSISERSQFFSQAIILAKERPFIGLGPYSFRFVQPRIQTAILATSDHPHNVFLKFAMERGIPAAVVFALFLVVVYAYALSSVFRSNVFDHRGLQTACMIVATTGVLAHNLIDYNLQFVGIALPFWLSLSTITLREENFEASTWFRRVTHLLFAGILLALLIFEGRNLFISSQARRAERRGDDSEALLLYSRSNPSFFSRDALLAESSMLLNAGKFTDAENHSTEYLLLNPNDARPWRLLGDIYLAWGKANDALRAYEKAYDLGSKNDAGILRGLVFLLRKHPEKLRERRHELDSLLNDYGLAILQNTHFIALSSNVEETVSAASLLARAFPADAGLYKALADGIFNHAVLERATYTSRPRGFLW